MGKNASKSTADASKTTTTRKKKGPGTKMAKVVDRRTINLRFITVMNTEVGKGDKATSIRKVILALIEREVEPVKVVAALVAL